MPDGTPHRLPPLARKGRGAGLNPPIRFETASRDAFDDGWGTLEAAFADLPPLPTTLTKDSAKSALAWNDSPDLGFDRAIQLWLEHRDRWRASLKWRLGLRSLSRTASGA